MVGMAGDAHAGVLFFSAIAVDHGRRASASPAAPLSSPRISWRREAMGKGERLSGIEEKASTAAMGPVSAAESRWIAGDQTSRNRV